MSVADRFDKFLDNIGLTTDQLAAGKARRESVVANMNWQYYGSISNTANSKFVGSWGKFTRIRPPRDVDVLFEMPLSVYNRFQQRSGNIQSQILSEIRTVLQKSYPNTAVRGDGPVVIIPFSSYNVELIPAFKLQNGQYYICMTDSGGRYKVADYNAEISTVSTSNTSYNNNTRSLVRMMKCWQGHCSVPIKSFWLELVAIDFLAQWEYAGESTYYDWMVRDFLLYLKNRANTYVFAPGTGEAMNMGSAWLSRAQSAYDRAAKAVGYESDYSGLAGDEWQKIFGVDIPR